MARIRVALAGDHVLLREGIGQLPDVVVTDIRMPPTRTDEALDRLASRPAGAPGGFPAGPGGVPGPSEVMVAAEGGVIEL